MPLKLRRGTSSNRTSITPAEGEPIYTTDTKKLYIGDGSTAGGVVVDTTGVADGDKGDITVSSSGATWTIDNDAVTYAKIQNVSATDRLLGRSSAGAGDIEEITCTSAGRALIDDADAAAQRTTLGLGTLATQSGTFSGTSSGTNTGDQNLFSTIAVSGQSNVVADSTSDTLTLVAGSNITLTTNATTDTITIASTAGGGTIDGSGAANKLAIWSDSDTLTSDTNLHWDTTNDRLGILNSSPSSTFQVGSSNGLAYDNASNQLQVYGGSGKGQMYLTANSANPEILLLGDSTNGFFPSIDFRPLGSTSTGGLVQSNSANGGLAFVGRGGANYYTSNGNFVSAEIRAGSGSQTANILTITNSSASVLSAFTANGSLVLGGSSASARLHSIATTEQLRLGHDTSNYASATVGSTGTVTLDAVGSGAKFVFSDAVEVPDSAYASGWNGSVAVPTRNAVYDRVQDVALAAITFIIDGGGSAITTGIKGDLEIPFACTIEEVIVLADQTGSIVVDIWKDTYANFPPTDADSITASATPTLSSAIKAQNNTLTGWTTSIVAGDILRFNVDSATTVQRVSIILQVRK